MQQQIPGMTGWPKESCKRRHSRQQGMSRDMQQFSHDKPRHPRLPPVQASEQVSKTTHRLVCTIFCSFCCTTGITLPADPGPPMSPLTPLKFALAPCSQDSRCNGE